MSTAQLMRQRVKEIAKDLENWQSQRDTLKARLDSINGRLQKLRDERAEIRESMTRLGISE